MGATLFDHVGKCLKSLLPSKPTVELAIALPVLFFLRCEPEAPEKDPEDMAKLRLCVLCGRHPVEHESYVFASIWDPLRVHLSPFGAPFGSILGILGPPGGQVGPFWDPVLKKVGFGSVSGRKG